MTSDEIRDRLHQLRAIPLESVLVATGSKRDHQDKAKWLTAKGAISLTGMKFMNWNQGRGGGGAIDLAMHLKGLDFKAAVEWLSRRFPLPDLFPVAAIRARFDIAAARPQQTPHGEAIPRPSPRHHTISDPVSR